MWTELAHTVLKYRLPLIIIIGLITIFMGYHARNVEWNYDFTKVVPDDDPDMVFFQDFKSLFGEDGNILVIGVKDSSLYTPENFRKFKYLSDEIGRIRGVQDVLSIPNSYLLEKDTEQKKFNLEPIFKQIPDSQSELDSLLKVANSQSFYSGQIINSENGATLILATLNTEYLNSKKRLDLTEDVKHVGHAFEENTGLELHYGGLPFFRSEMATKVKRELQMFLLFSVIITAIIMWFFFRSWDAVLFPMIVIAVMVIWVVGTLSLFGYKITLLSALIPPIIVVIGIPNSIYLLNKYHHEFDYHGNKIRALSVMVRKIGLITLITNFTTSIGFLVLNFTQITVLKEFGLVAGINILATFFVSIIFIPAIFSYLPPPSKRQLKHLDFVVINKVLNYIDRVVHRKRIAVFVVTGIVVTLAVIGIFRVESVSYIVDDLPKKSKIMQDLRFFERNFSGIMPLDILVDTGKKRGVLSPSNLRKVNELEEYLASQPELSQPVSLVTLVKAARQAFYNNNPSYYALPNRDRNFILSYLRNQQDSVKYLKSFVDSTGQVMRISIKIADIGSNQMRELIQERIEPAIDSVFADTNTEVRTTGTSYIFVKGNQFLIENLRLSLLIAFLLISLIMAILFRNFKMILISLIPNVIPIIITAGLMGYFGIVLKPSTALIFSIAFGISVDDSIHFLAKYRQELFANKFFVPLAVSRSIRETGSSMIYTSVVLFAGFIIFAASRFGGTQSLGILTSLTLLIAMFTNLIVLPSLLLAFDSGKRRRDAHPLIEHIDESEEDDPLVEQNDENDKDSNKKI